MAKDETVTREEFEESNQKFNDLCDYLDSMKLNPLSDFEQFKVEESYTDDVDEEFEDDVTLDEEEVKKEVQNGRGF
jgi:hypothetical protein